VRASWIYNFYFNPMPGEEVMGLLGKFSFEGQASLTLFG